MKKLILLLGIMLAVFACEKEQIQPPGDPVEVLGTWDLYHEVNGTSTNDFNINGDTWNYTLVIHNLCIGEIHTVKNGVFYRTYKFYLNVQEDSIHFSYWYDPTPLMPAPGWNDYLQFDNVLLIEYQSWIKQ